MVIPPSYMLFEHMATHLDAGNPLEPSTTTFI